MKDYNNFKKFRLQEREDVQAQIFSSDYEQSSTAHVQWNLKETWGKNKLILSKLLEELNSFFSIPQIKRIQPKIRYPIFDQILTKFSDPSSITIELFIRVFWGKIVPWKPSIMGVNSPHYVGDNWPDNEGSYNYNAGLFCSWNAGFKPRVLAL